MPVTDPIRQGLASTSARPGGNVTGLSYSVSPEIFGKDLVVLRDVVPEVRHGAVLSNPAGPNQASLISNIDSAVQAIGVKLLRRRQKGSTLPSHGWSTNVWGQC